MSHETESKTKISQLSIDLCRELYDRFVMGGWGPRDAHAEVEAMLRESVAAPSEDAERREFEQWAVANLYPLQICSSPNAGDFYGEYACADTRLAWRGWLARSRREAK